MSNGTQFNSLTTPRIKVFLSATITYFRRPPIALDLPEARQSYGRMTKIVATIGPTSNTWETFGALARAGLNVARLNMSHGDHSTHGAVVDLIRRHNATAATPVAMMVDTKVHLLGRYETAIFHTEVCGALLCWLW